MKYDCFYYIVILSLFLFTTSLQLTAQNGIVSSPCLKKYIKEYLNVFKWLDTILPKNSNRRQLKDDSKPVIQINSKRATTQKVNEPVSTPTDTSLKRSVSLHPTAIVINLDRRPDRLKAIAQRLQFIKVPFQRLSAVDGNRKQPRDIPSNILLDPMATMLRWNMIGKVHYGLGALGCYLSHLLVLNRIASDAVDGMAYLVLEDDADFDEDMPKRAQDAIALLDSANEWMQKRRKKSLDWDIFYLGHDLASFDPYDPIEDYLRANSMKYNTSRNNKSNDDASRVDANDSANKDPSESTSRVEGNTEVRQDYRVGKMTAGMNLHAYIINGPKAAIKLFDLLNKTVYSDTVDAVLSEAMNNRWIMAYGFRQGIAYQLGAKEPSDINTEVTKEWPNHQKRVTELLKGKGKGKEDDAASQTDSAVGKNVLCREDGLIPGQQTRSILLS